MIQNTQFHHRKPSYDITIPSVMSLISSKRTLNNTEFRVDYSQERGSLSVPRAVKPVKVLSLNLPSIYSKSISSPPVKILKFQDKKNKNEWDSEGLKGYFIPKNYFNRGGPLLPIRLNKLNCGNQRIKILNCFVK